MNETEIPLFPLRTVLFPGGLLPLRIFEARYVDMVSQCMRDNQPFGVLLIVQGGETGRIGALAEVGTSARVVDFETLPDGLLGLLARGETRFRLIERRVKGNGLHLGQVQWLESPAAPVPAEHEPLAEVLKRVLPAMGKTASFLEPHWDDAGWLADRFAELLPLERDAQQFLLEIADPLQRLNRLAPLVDTTRL